MASQFASPYLATFTFIGEAEAAFRGDILTRVWSTPTTETTVVTDTKVSTTTPNGVTTTTDTIKTTSKTTKGPTTVRTTRGPATDPNNGVIGYVGAQASSDNYSDYTFETTRGEKVAVSYLTLARLGAPVVYGVEIIDDTTQTLVGTLDWIGSNADGEVLWNLGSPGTYSLIIGEVSNVNVPGNLAEWSQGVFPSQGVFQMSIMSAPELSTWGMMLIGLAGLGSVAFRRASRQSAGRQVPSI
jgi:hypothetical protein